MSYRHHHLPRHLGQLVVSYVSSSGVQLVNIPEMSKYVVYSGRTSLALSNFDYEQHGLFAFDEESILIYEIGRADNFFSTLLSSNESTTREQLRQLQQRMEFLEAQFRAQNNAPATSAIAVEPNVPVTSDADPSPTAMALPGEGKTLEVSNNGANVPSTGQDGRPDSIELANGKVRIGTLLYADYAYYTKTGFGPQFTSQINPPGPANNGYNTFEITRAYINLFYSPSEAITFRLTPDLYRQIGAAPAAKIGKVSAIGPNTDQGQPASAPENT